MESQTPAPDSSELALKRKELRLSFWTNTILVGVLGGIVTVVFSLLDVKQKQDELLHRQRELALNYGELEFKLVGEPLQRIIRDPCAKDAAQARTYLNTILGVGIVDQANVGKYEEIARVLTGQCRQSEALAAKTPMGTCQEVVSIIKLGWTSGHKTNFCKAKGYDSVWNRPNSSYSSGGYCYKGDDLACRAAIEAGRTQ